MMLSKESNISEADFVKIQDQINTGKILCSEVFKYLDLINVPEDRKINAYVAAYDNVGINADKTIDLPVSVEYIECDDNTYYKVTFQSKRVETFFQLNLQECNIKIEKGYFLPLVLQFLFFLLVIQKFLNILLCL